MKKENNNVKGGEKHMNYTNEPFDNIFYEDDIIETKLTEEDEKNLEEIRKEIESRFKFAKEFTKEFKDNLYHTLKDYYKEAIERGFYYRGLEKNIIYDLAIIFETIEYNQSSLLWSEDNYVKYNLIIETCEYYDCYEHHIVIKNYEIKNESELVTGYVIDIDIYNNSVQGSAFDDIDKEELDEIVKNIKINFNMK